MGCEALPTRNVIPTIEHPINFRMFEILIKFADEPEFTKVEYFTPSQFDHFFSNSLTFFDWVKIKGFDLMSFFNTVMSVS